MATLTLQEVGAGGLGAVSFVAASAGGDDAPGGTVAARWGLRAILIVRNDSGAAVDVTVGSLAAVSVPSGGEGAIPVTIGIYRGGLVPVTYSAVTSVTVAAVGLGNA